MPKIRKDPVQSSSTQKKASVPVKMQNVGIPKGLMSSCLTGWQVELRLANSSATPKHWHDTCRGAIVNGREEITHRCTCSCHAETDWKCLTCRQAGFFIDEVTGSCANKNACAKRAQESVEAWWVNRGYAPILSGMSTSDRLALEDAGLGPVLLTPGQCEHCGEDVEEDGVTAFLQGHEGVLKKQLKTNLTDLDCLVEMALRGWLTKYLITKIDPNTMLKAEILLTSLEDPIDWALTRAVARW